MKRSRKSDVFSFMPKPNKPHSDPFLPKTSNLKFELQCIITSVYYLRVVISSCTQTRLFELCLGTFDPHIPVCFTSVMGTIQIS